MVHTGQIERERGFTFIEVVIALFLMSVGVIATAPLFIYATQMNAAGGDFGSASAIAVRQMEQLRGLSYLSLTIGGSVTDDVTGYADLSDPDFVVRWLIETDNTLPALTKVITVRVIAVSAIRTGEQKEVTLRTVRGS